MRTKSGRFGERSIEPSMFAPPASATTPGDTRTCPYCAEQVLVAAIK
jgi:hypothetical protein